MNMLSLSPLPLYGGGGLGAGETCGIVALFTRTYFCASVVNYFLLRLLCTLSLQRQWQPKQ